MLKKLLAALVALTVSTVTAVAFTAAPAQAAPSCDFYRICFFDASNWQSDANYPKYVVNPSGLPANTCYNFGTDPTGFNWDRQVDSIWWNEILYPDSMNRDRKSVV